MHTGSIIVLITIFVYLVGMVLIGVYYGKRNSSTSEFYLGGRTLGPYVTAMSAEASDMSSYLLMGIPGLAYLSGMAHAGWTIAGLAIGTYFNWLFTAQRLRRYTHITDSFTFPQFLSHRFHEEKNVLAAIGAVVIVIFFVPYTASGFAACGKVFSTLLGLDYTVTMVVSAIVIVSYIAIGGFLAVSMTDFIQSIIMSVAIFFVVGFAVVNAGGVDIILDNARALPGYLSATLSYDPTTDSSTSFGLLSIITTLSWGLGYFGMPHILLRFMAIEDEQKLKVSRRVGTGWVILAMALAVCIGIAGHTLSLEGVIPMARRLCFGKHPDRDRQSALWLWRARSDHGRDRYLRYPRQHDVHGVVPASGGGEQREPGILCRKPSTSVSQTSRALVWRVSRLC